MPTTVADAFSAAGPARQAVVRWGTRPSTGDSGVYVVSLTDSSDAIETTLPAAPLATEAFESWLQVCPELTLDGARPIIEHLMRRIQGWLADETILYIGLATSLSPRLGAYYKTPIGARRPHSGGYFLKLLSNLDERWVHYTPSADPEGAEDGMLRRFCASVSDESKRALIDPAHPFPFANLELLYLTPTIDVPFTAEDAIGLASVELWVRHRSTDLDPWGLWPLAAVGSASPFSYTVAHGDGSYEFYTLAVDDAGNPEAPPARADAATRVLLSGTP